MKQEINHKQIHSFRMIIIYKTVIKTAKLKIINNFPLYKKKLSENQILTNNLLLFRLKKI